MKNIVLLAQQSDIITERFNRDIRLIFPGIAVSQQPYINARIVDPRTEIVVAREEEALDETERARAYLSELIQRGETIFGLQMYRTSVVPHGLRGVIFQGYIGPFEGILASRGEIIGLKRLLSPYLEAPLPQTTRISPLNMMVPVLS